jgi:hypothetical protein
MLLGETDESRLRKVVNREEKLMRKDRLSRELGPREVPEDADESLPEAATVSRRPPDSEPLASGSEHRAGVEHEELPPPPEAAPAPEDPPRGRKPSGEQ